MRKCVEIMVGSVTLFLSINASLVASLPLENGQQEAPSSKKRAETPIVSQDSADTKRQKLNDLFKDPAIKKFETRLGELGATDFIKGVENAREVYRTLHHKTSLNLDLDTLLSYSLEKECKISNTDPSLIKDILSLVQSNSRITSLSLRDVSITDEAMPVITQLLQTSSLRDLDLGGCKLGDAKIKTLAQSVQSNKSLLSLNLSDNNITSESLLMLVHTLTQTTLPLTHLMLDKNDIGDEGVCIISEALQANKVLKELSLNAGNITDKGAQDLSTALTKNQTLATLKLSQNKISYLGVALLAKALIHNISLQELDLSKNDIDDDAATLLGDALRQNTSLISLNLFGNKITKTGQKYLFETVTKVKQPNPRLKDIVHFF